MPHIIAHYDTCVKVFSSIRHTSKFLSAICNLMRAFNIYEKKNCIKSLEETIVMVPRCLEKNQTYITNIKILNSSGIYFIGTKDIR